MAKIRLKYIDTFKDRQGQVRYYFRRGKGARVPLPGRPGSREFMDAYAEALHGVSELKPTPGASGTIWALVTRYLDSAEFAALADDTRKNYRRLLDHFRTATGDRSIVGFSAMAADRLLEQIQKERGAHPAYALWRVLRKLFAFAKDKKIRADDPMQSVKAPKRPKSDGFRTATQDDAEKFRAFYALGTRERLAFELLYWTGARRADIVQMGHQQLADGVLTYTTLKTGVEISIPVAPELLAAIKAVPRTNMTFVVTEYGAPFTGNGFGNWFREKCQAAGLPAKTSPHTLRKALLTRLADNGATAHEIMAVSGHQHVAEVQTYTKRADRKRLAKSGLEKLAPRAKTEQDSPNGAVPFGKAVEK